MENYPYGYCGMPCALCSRFRTEGKSKCAGCSQCGYYTDVCKVFRCCRDRKLTHCGECEKCICERLGKMGDFRDLNTDNVKKRTCEFISARGFELWFEEYKERADMLTEALARYNDGRMKRYLCELFIRNDIQKLRDVMTAAKALSGTEKERAKAFKSLVEEI